MKKCYNCGYSFSNSEICPACGGVQSKQSYASKSGQNQRGKIVQAEQLKSESLFIKYADFIDDQSLFQTACCLLDGIGVEKNTEQAMEMLQILSYRGFCPAIYKLADHYLTLRREYVDVAIQWLKTAAELGHKPSQIKLKLLGETIETDFYENCTSVLSDHNLDVGVRGILDSIVMISVMTGGDDAPQKAIGAGFIVGKGYVITNAHVIGDSPISISAYFEPSVDTKIYNLMPIAVAPQYDIAVLRFVGLADQKISQKKHLELCLELPEYGENVYTIGNPLGLSFSLSKGIVSSPSRQGGHCAGVQDVIQTDISANQGNSGGALLNANNKVLGIISYVPSDSEGGISMCVPSKYIVQVLNELG